MRNKLILTGFALVVCAFVAVLLVIADKPHFGWLVGSGFLPAITIGVILGGLLMLIGALRLPRWKTWRGLTLIVWSIIAMTSPLFGIMFLLPWGILAITAPLVIWILLSASAPAPSYRPAGEAPPPAA